MRVMVGSRTSVEDPSTEADMVTAAETVPSADDSGEQKLWYVLKVQSNREKSIRDNLLRRIKREGLRASFW